jgi:hypothetical protein
VEVVENGLVVRKRNGETGQVKKKVQEVVGEVLDAFS